MLVWLGLNVALTLSSMYRLQVYVEADGLTYLRIRAGIWMVLVAVWLGLIAWQTVKERANGWLVGRSLALGLGTLYLGCFVNFAEVIARHNFERANVTDWSFCQLTQTSKTALKRTDGAARCQYDGYLPAIENWRDWDFRTWRVLRYIEADGAQKMERVYENPRG